MLTDNCPANCPANCLAVSDRQGRPTARRCPGLERLADESRAPVPGRRFWWSVCQVCPARSPICPSRASRYCRFLRWQRRAANAQFQGRRRGTSCAVRSSGRDVLGGYLWIHGILSCTASPESAALRRNTCRVLPDLGEWRRVGKAEFSASRDAYTRRGAGSRWRRRHRPARQELRHVWQSLSIARQTVTVVTQGNRPEPYRDAVRGGGLPAADGRRDPAGRHRRTGDRQRALRNARQFRKKVQ